MSGSDFYFTAVWHVRGPDCCRTLTLTLTLTAKAIALPFFLFFHHGRS
jgi:hypothetical protein